MQRTAKTALVTGASAGLGTHFARLFAQDGHDLVLVARRQDKLDQLATELREVYGIHPTVIAADLTDPKAPLHLHEEVMRAGIEVEFLVNNAGFGTSGAFAELNLARELDLIELNVKALTQLTGLVLPAMVARRSGRILNLGSMAGFLPGPFMATYYASKAYVLSFTEALAYELRGTGVTATVLCPGATATEFARVAGIESTALFTSSADAASIALYGYRSMLKGKTIAVPGVKAKLSLESLRVSPRAVVRVLAAHLNKP
ncbi:MAG: SDR family oxidoreductase [Pseudonocardiales bacterium]|nr:SDR family oxidoreductase [Pseudonocardiales bacterium]MBV9029105.1 SDR family oxidoreductase [Pseudonocardiales bacterium]